MGHVEVEVVHEGDAVLSVVRAEGGPSYLMGTPSSLSLEEALASHLKGHIRHLLRVRDEAEGV